MSDLITKWRKELDAVHSANQWDTEAELAWLAEQASKHDSILECGAFKGASTKIMALANPMAHIVVLDMWSDPGTREAFQELLAVEIAEGRITAIQASTVVGFDLLPKGFVPTFSFIDAGHLYADVEHDIRRTLEIQTEGTVSGHDYRHNLPSDGVTKAVNEAFLEGLYFPADSIWAADLNMTQLTKE